MPLLGIFGRTYTGRRWVISNIKSSSLQTMGGRALHSSGASVTQWATLTCLPTCPLKSRSAAWGGRGFRTAGSGQYAHGVRAMSAGSDAAPSVGEIDVAALHALLSDAGNAAEDVQLVDVREEMEERIAALPGFKLMPLSRFQEWAPLVTEMLDPSKPTYVLCHHGMRSYRASTFLASQGFEDVRNVTGGIDAYSREVDSSVPQY
ncbi:hypothetical protein WJX75_008855 [Coccomyxa subellipsoidea]|uniref:Rhodanese domain-containing protein n=1 Tax=Coccomyxa subellipsoidea TaxID=248742 RepID=A0ABR2YGW0_9CHLO